MSRGSSISITGIEPMVESGDALINFAELIELEVFRVYWLWDLSALTN